MPEPLATRTGPAVEALVEAVREDIEQASVHLRAAGSIFGRLAEEGRGVNDVTAACNGLASQIQGMLAAAAKEVSDVERKLLGGATKEPIIATVDEEHVGRVRAARKEAAS